MDGTLVAKPGIRKSGRYEMPPLTQSPVREPLLRWLRLGGRLLVVTSEDGGVPTRRVWDCIPPELRRQVRIATSDGAAMWRDDGGQGGSCVQDTNYSAHALEYAAVRGNKCKTTGIPNEHMGRLLDVARGMHLRFFADMAEERRRGRGTKESPKEGDLWRHLGAEHQKNYEKVLDRLVEGEPVEEVLTMDTLLHFSRVMPGWTLLWRNQPGPRETWAGFAEHEPPQDRSPHERPGLCITMPNALYMNLIVLGMPRAVAHRYLTQDVHRELEKLGCSGSAAPNSVWFKNAAVDKSLPLRYLEGGADAEMGQLVKQRAVAFGDNPGGNDKPLTYFTKEGLGFVSVAPTVEEVPEHLRECHVGGLEAGMAEVLEEMTALLEAGRLEEVLASAAGLREIAGRARARVRAAAAEANL